MKTSEFVTKYQQYVDPIELEEDLKLVIKEVLTDYMDVFNDSIKAATPKTIQNYTETEFQN